MDFCLVVAKFVDLEGLEAAVGLNPFLLQLDFATDAVYKTLSLIFWLTF